MRKFHFPTRAIIFIVVLAAAMASCISSPSTPEEPRDVDSSPTPWPTETDEPPEPQPVQQEDTPIVPPTVVPASPIVPPIVTPSATAIVPPVAPPTQPLSGGSGSSSCPGAPPQRLTVGELAYVCTISDPVRLRNGPGKNYNPITSLDKGTDIYVVDGPICADNWTWWQVETESGDFGWMAEGGDNVDPYFICPR